MTDHFQKTVQIKAVDEAERTATGAVLVPDELDHQHDFLRADAVERFHSDDVTTGVMHSAFPDDAATLERNEVLDAPETIGDEELPAGTWVATRRYEDDRLWNLVSDGVLQGFSIGGEIERAADHDELPDDVRVPDDVDHDGAGGTELIDGTVEEVSDVDIPAVPRATYKGGALGKSLLDEVDGEEEFVELMVEQRGHDADDARRLYQYLIDARKTPLSRQELLRILKSGEGKPGDTFDECVEIIMDERGVSEQDAREICGALEEENKVDVNGTEVDLTPPDAVVNAAQAALDAKEEFDAIADCGTGVGEDRARAIIDNDLQPADFVGGERTAIPDYLDSHSEDVDGIDEPPTDWDEATWTDGCGPVQYALWGGTATGTGLEWANDTEQEIRDAMEQSTMSDEPDDATKWQILKSIFIGSDDANAAEALDATKASDDMDEDEDEDDEEDGDDDDEDDKHAADGETSDTDMTNDDTDKSDEPPAWAESLTETVEEIDKRVDEIEAGGDDTEKAMADAPAWAQDLAEKVDDLDERVDTISKQSGHSQQLDGTEQTGEEPDDEVAAFKSRLVGGRTGGDD